MDNFVRVSVPPRLNYCKLNQSEVSLPSNHHIFLFHHPADISIAVVHRSNNLPLSSCAFLAATPYAHLRAIRLDRLYSMMIDSLALIMYPKKGS